MSYGGGCEYHYIMGIVHDNHQTVSKQNQCKHWWGIRLSSTQQPSALLTPRKSIDHVICHIVCWILWSDSHRFIPYGSTADPPDSSFIFNILITMCTSTMSQLCPFGWASHFRTGIKDTTSYRSTSPATDTQRNKEKLYVVANLSVLSPLLVFSSLHRYSSSQWWSSTSEVFFVCVFRQKYNTQIGWK